MSRATAASASSVVDKFWGWPTAGAFALLAIVMALLYVRRGQVLLWLLGQGTGTLERILLQTLGSGGRDLKWVIIRPPHLKMEVLGVVTAETDQKVAVFVPSAPKLLPGQLVFTEQRQVRELPGLTLREGLELLVTLGYAPNAPDAVAKVFAETGE